MAFDRGEPQSAQTGEAKRDKDRPKLISAFTGAGGLDIGLEASGFQVALAIESDGAARQTLRHNRSCWKVSNPSCIEELRGTQALAQAGVTPKRLDLISAGPPCQPFSRSGSWVNGHPKKRRDRRARPLSALFELVEVALPRAILLENVEAFQFGRRRGAYDFVTRRLREINERTDSQYLPVPFVMDAAEYGVAQHRRRFFVVAARDGTVFVPPPPTHGPGRLPLVTAWQALGDLAGRRDPELQPKGKWAALLPSIPEGKNYLWHTPDGGGQPLFGWRTRYWSFLLKLDKAQPSWTIQAAPGPATGPFHWDSRLLSVRELARLQSFPDAYEFPHSRRIAHVQIGNAVPPMLGEILGREIQSQLLNKKPSEQRAIGIPMCTSPAPSRKPTKVPRQYLDLVGKHPPHPGAGKGPGARSRGRRQT